MVFTDIKSGKTMDRPGLPDAFAVGSLPEHDVGKTGGDACHGKAPQERRLGLDELESVAAVDHRRLILMSVKKADHIVAGDGPQQGASP